jgi:hypothetical protein
MITGRAWGQSNLMSTEELTNRASVVAVARVASVQSEWSADRSRILTRVGLTVEQYLKGERAERTLTIVVPGGEIDGVGELYSHAARFKPQEEVVLFAERDSRGNLRVVGGEQGKFTVGEDKATGRRVVGENQAFEVFTDNVKQAVKKNPR